MAGSGTYLPRTVCQDARHHCAAVAARPCRRGDRITGFLLRLLTAANGTTRKWWHGSLTPAFESKAGQPAIAAPSRFISARPNLIRSAQSTSFLGRVLKK